MRFTFSTYSKVLLKYADHRIGVYLKRDSEVQMPQLCRRRLSEASVQYVPAVDSTRVEMLNENVKGRG